MEIKRRPTVAYGDEPRVQQQVVPLSAAASIAPAPAAPAPPAASGVAVKDYGAAVALEVEALRTRAGRVPRNGVATPRNVVIRKTKVNGLARPPS
jgi:hypothetical protein